MGSERERLTLSAAAEAHLENLLDIEAERRPRDAALRSPVVDGRDALFVAASNLECVPPQAQPSVAARLRVVADLLVEQDVLATAYHATRTAMQIVTAPRLRALAGRVRTMAHDDAEIIAASLCVIADSLSEAP